MRRTTGEGTLPRRYHALALSTLAGIATLRGMRPGPRRRHRPKTYARAGAVLGLIIYLIPLAAAMPRTGRGGAVDRAPGIVLARYRQAQLDVAADDRPVLRPPALALPPACMPTVLVPDPAGCEGEGSLRDDVASRPLPAGAPRSPPVP